MSTDITEALNRIKKVSDYLHGEPDPHAKKAWMAVSNVVFNLKQAYDLTWTRIAWAFNFRNDLTKAANYLQKAMNITVDIVPNLAKAQMADNCKGSTKVPYYARMYFSLGNQHYLSLNERLQTAKNLARRIGFWQDLPLRDAGKVNAELVKAIKLAEDVVPNMIESYCYLQDTSARADYEQAIYYVAEALKFVGKGYTFAAAYLRMMRISWEQLHKAETPYNQGTGYMNKIKQLFPGS